MQVGDDEEVSVQVIHLVVSVGYTFGEQLQRKCRSTGKADVQGRKGLQVLASKGMGMDVYTALSEEFVQSALYS